MSAATIDRLLKPHRRRGLRRPFGTTKPGSLLKAAIARWTARIGLGEQVTTKTLRRRFFSLAGRITRSARRLTLHLPRR